jgi:hypothetical protein
MALCFVTDPPSRPRMRGAFALDFYAEWRETACDHKGFLNLPRRRAIPVNCAQHSRIAQAGPNGAEGESDAPCEPKEAKVHAQAIDSL